jgi:hypothetical protein
VRQDLYDMQRRIERLNRVEAARIRLEELGGPPTRQTIPEALERSLEERLGIRPRQSVSTPQESPTDSLRQKPSVRESESPWMAQTGGVDALSPDLLASARNSYNQWQYKDRFSFSDYVQYTQEKWQEDYKQTPRESIKQSVSSVGMA